LSKTPVFDLGLFEFIYILVCLPEKRITPIAVPDVITVLAQSVFSNEIGFLAPKP